MLMVHSFYFCTYRKHCLQNKLALECKMAENITLPLLVTSIQPAFRSWPIWYCKRNPTVWNDKQDSRQLVISCIITLHFTFLSLSSYTIFNINPLENGVAGILTKVLHLLYFWPNLPLTETCGDLGIASLMFLFIGPLCVALSLSCFCLFLFRFWGPWEGEGPVLSRGFPPMN